MMSGVVYVLCATTALLCAWLLFRAYRGSGSALLFWSAICFALLALNNAMLIADRLMFPDLDLSAWRSLPALAGLAVLLYGLIWHGE
jgi:hypothetical protein